MVPHLKCADLTSAVTSLVATLQESGAVPESCDLVAEVLRREDEGSTAVGDGLAVPHARCRGVEGVHIAVATLDTPLDLNADDGKPVDIVILLIGPERDPRQMLRVLARLARLVKDRAFLGRLRQADDAASLLDVFVEAGD